MLINILIGEILVSFEAHELLCQSTQHNVLPRLASKDTMLCLDMFGNGHGFPRQCA